MNSGNLTVNHFSAKPFHQPSRVAGPRFFYRKLAPGVAVGLRLLKNVVLELKYH